MEGDIVLKPATLHRLTPRTAEAEPGRPTTPAPAPATAPAPGTATFPAADPGDPLDRLFKLGRLRVEGIVDDREFEILKNRIIWNADTAPTGA